MNDMVPVRHNGADIEAYRASTEAATICKEIVVATSSQIQGKNYVSVEGWQAIAVAHGCAAGASDVERVEGGVRATGEVRRMSDGQLIARAEGFVGEDEAVWFGGTVTNKWGKTTTHQKRPDYAIRAMAQTRAISRACRSAFAHVVVMMNAGLATTPAEEMVTIDGETGEVIETGERQQGDPKIPGITKIRNNLNKLRRDGGKATDLETFNALVHACKDDLEKIRDAKHSLWTGMGEDFDGFNRWIRTRREELTPKQETAAFQLLCSLVQEATSYSDLSGILEEHEATIANLDGEESRRFDEAYNARETEIISKSQPTPMTAGAFGA